MPHRKKIVTAVTIFKKRSIFACEKKEDFYLLVVSMDEMTGGKFKE